MKNFFLTILRFFGLAKPKAIETLDPFFDEKYSPTGLSITVAATGTALHPAQPEALGIVATAKKVVSTPVADPNISFAAKADPTVDPKAPTVSVGNDQGDPALQSFLALVPELSDENGFVLDLVVQGFSSFPLGYNSFQIGDVIVEGAKLVSFENGGMLKGTPDGLGGYVTEGRLVSAGKIDFKGDKAYTARFGGYGSQTHAQNSDGTLYRFYFDGPVAGSRVELVDYYFSNFSSRYDDIGVPVIFQG